MKRMFAHIVEAPIDPILGTAIAYKADANPKKVNLGIGANRDEAGQPVVFKAVRKVEMEHAADEACFKEYGERRAPVDMTRPRPLWHYLSSLSALALSRSRSDRSSHSAD
jgi:hypothetical protein